MDTAVQAADSCISRVWDCVAPHRQIRYVINHQENIEALESEMRTLMNSKQEKIIEEGNCSPPTRDWVEKVNKANTDVEKITNSSAQMMLCCSGNCRINCCCSLWISRQAFRKLPVIRDLNAKADRITRQHFVDELPTALSNHNNTVPAVEIPTSPMDLKEALSKVHHYLRDGGIGVIGIFGMSGIGKTELINNIFNHYLRRPDEFAVVIKVDVTEKVDIGKIRMAIRKRLNLPPRLDLKEEDDKRDEILMRLNSTKFLLLLDNVWENMDVHALGVPCNYKEKRSKIVLATQSKDVCSQMRSDLNIELRCLKDDEARDLFLQELSVRNLAKNPWIPELANEIIKTCDGHPLLLITVAKAMANKERVEEWVRMKESLKNVSTHQITGMEDVFKKLMVGFANLKDSIKQCFLYFSLFPESYSIESERLIDYWKGEGFLDDENDDIPDVYVSGICIIEELKRDCLLMAGDKETEVKMHDAFRKLALWITSEYEDHNYKFTKNAAGQQLTKAPNVDRWKGAKRISLMENKIEKLTETPDCPQLITLILQQNQNLNEICDSFFQSMPLLKVLDLSYTRIKKLPTEISNLVKLQYLNVSHTKLAALPELMNKLDELRYLNLSHTEITTLPDVVRSLEKLKCLNLGHTTELKQIPPGVIIKLSKLQVLNLYGSLYADWAEGDGVRLLELECLNELTALEITINNMGALEILKSSDKLPKCIRQLQIHWCDADMIQLPSIFSKMKSLEISNGTKLKKLIIDTRAEEKHWSCLERLTLLHLQILNDIQVEVIPYTCLQNLHYLNISYCHELKNITFITRLENLEEIKLDSCNELEEVIDGSFATVTTFSRLKIIDMQSLTNLKSISSQALSFPSLERIVVAKCPNLKNLGLDASIVRRNLLEIQGDKDWWNALELEENAKSRLHCYFRVNNQ